MGEDVCSKTLGGLSDDLAVHTLVHLTSFLTSLCQFEANIWLI